MNNNEKKTIVLGMPHNKARHQLMKAILFHLIQKLGLDICYRCNKKIETIKDLSVDHKKAWLNSSNARELYFDLDNVGFSHLTCNCSFANHKKTEEQKQNLSFINAGRNATLPFDRVIEIREKIKQGEGIRKTAREYNISHVHVLNIRDLKRRKYK